jgi:hypothetical protein
VDHLLKNPAKAVEKAGEKLEEFSKDPLAYTRNLMEKVENYAIERMVSKIKSLCP